MKRARAVLAIAVGMITFGAYGAAAQTIIGDLNNFDTLNDTGQICYGFEIEISDIHSTDITYTFDWNHYGPPKIREDNSDPAHPKVFIRYESVKDASGQWGANGTFTNPALPTLTPPAGHTCTDTSVNEGCEHFGVGYYGTPTTVKYHWLIDDNAGGLVYFGTPVGVAAPKWTYTPPQGGAPAQVVAAIPAPAAPVAGKEFGEPFWVKVIKTTSHNANPVALADLIAADTDSDGKADWQNGEPDETEIEWKLLQARVGGGGPNDELQGGADDMGDGSEVVTRRYEFYRYGADPNTLDGETGEAMCSEVQTATDPADPLYRHGVGTQVAVTDASGNTYYVNCEAQVVVGNYVGAQMAGFAAAAPLGLIDHLQDGVSGDPYTPRTVVVGGTAPFTVSYAPGGSLPPGLSIGPDGVLSGVPSQAGDFTFTVQATDDVGASVSAPYVLHVAGAAIPQLALTVQKAGSGSGAVSGNGIACGGTCSTMLDAGTAVVLSATADAGSRFAGWSGACTGTADCSFPLTVSSTVTAQFTKQWLLSVSTSGGGTGTVSGSGIDCGATCSVLLDQDTPVSLLASATDGSVFTGWSGDCAGIGACSPAMTVNRSVVATFVPPTQQYTVSVSVAGSGSVSSSPKGINCHKDCAQSFPVGTSVTLTAKPSGRKHSFLGWTGACATSGASLTCTMPILGDATVGAAFD